MYLLVQTGGVDAETGKNRDFLSGTLFCRCRADRRRGRRDRKNHDFIRGLMYLQVQTGGVDAVTGKNHLSVYNCDRSLSGVIALDQVQGLPLIAN
jgi:hypothetical protein